MGPQLKADLESHSHRFLAARAVLERYGVTAMTLHRWRASESMKFPPPLYFGRFRYWRLEDLLAWEATRPSIGTPVGAAHSRASQNANSST